jgi:rhodanese-related sulfurtransferase
LGSVFCTEVIASDISGKTSNAQLNQVAQGNVQTVNVAKAYELYESGAQFVDTRTWFEMSLFGKVDGALAMRDGQVFDVAKNLLPDKQRDVVLYCAVGVRASHAAEKLKELGYTSVYVLGDGEGFSNWKKAGLPISK